MRHEEVAHTVEIQPPLVAAARREHFERMARRMVAPHRRTHGGALGRRRAGLADERVAEHSVATVKPAIGAPRKTVERLVRILKTPTVEEHLRRSIRHVVMIPIGNEEQMRGGADPDAAKTEFEAAHEVQFLGEHFFRFKHAITILILEDNDAVLTLPFWLAVRISVGLGDPEPPPFIDSHGDGLV